MLRRHWAAIIVIPIELGRFPLRFLRPFAQKLLMAEPGPHYDRSMARMQLGAGIGVVARFLYTHSLTGFI